MQEQLYHRQHQYSYTHQQNGGGGEVCPCTSIAGQDNPFYRHDMNYYNVAGGASITSGAHNAGMAALFTALLLLLSLGGLQYILHCYRWLREN